MGALPTGELQPTLLSLSRSLPIWIVMAIVLLLLYFCTQQDIAVEGDRDDRRRRLVLRMKCLWAMGISGLGSLVVIVGIVQWWSLGFSGQEAKSWIRDGATCWSGLFEEWLDMGGKSKL
jgi:hypothetical protein